MCGAAAFSAAEMGILSWFGCGFLHDERKALRVDGLGAHENGPAILVIDDALYQQQRQPPLDFQHDSVLGDLQKGNHRL